MVEEGQAEDSPVFDHKVDAIVRSYMMNGKQSNHTLILFLNHAELILNYFNK